MANFITLNCPSCGGKLSVSPGTISLTCQHCGNEHMVKQDAGGALQLESFARCPVCGRNDRCEKVTAVIASQSHEISGTEKKTETIVNPQGQQVQVMRDVPFTRQQISTLGARLAPPAATRISGELPAAPGSGSWVLSGLLTAGLGACLGLGGLLYLGGGAAEAFSQTGSATTEEILVTLLAGCGGSAAGLVVIAAAVGIFILGRRNVARKQEEHAARIRDIFSERRQVQEAWEAAMERWRGLYYCARDDVVFLPGDGSSAPIEAMSAYLYKHAPGR